MSEVEERISRIKTHKGVKGLLIVNSEGHYIRSTFAHNTEAHKYAQHITKLALKARSTVRDLDPLNDLTFLRIRSKKHEIMVAPDKDYFLIVIQSPNEDQKENQ